jgi:thimet oligopeptidase
MSALLRSAWIVAIPFLVTAAAAQEMPKSQPPLWSGNPNVATFEKTENDRLAAAQTAIDRILAVKGTRTIENTLGPFDEALQQMSAASNISSLMEQVHPDKVFRDHATAMTRKISGAGTALSLNRAVFQALASLDASKADPATRYYVQQYLLKFHLAGVDQDAATREKLARLQDQLTERQSAFARNISDDVRSVELSDASELDGLPKDYIDKHKPASDGKIHITTAYPDVFPALTFATSDRLRRGLFEAFISRAYPKNRDVLLSIMRTRYEIASLLGYSSWADYNAADKMVGNASNIAKFIEQLKQASDPAAKREFAIVLAEKRKTDPEAKEIASYDWYRLSELVRRSQYDFDSQSVRPYLPYPRVKKGILDTAATLFHVTFRQELVRPRGMLRLKPGM